MCETALVIFGPCASAAARNFLVNESNNVFAEDNRESNIKGREAVHEFGRTALAQAHIEKYQEQQVDDWGRGHKYQAKVAKIKDVAQETASH